MAEGRAKRGHGERIVVESFLLPLSHVSNLSPIALNSVPTLEQLLCPSSPFTSITSLSVQHAEGQRGENIQIIQHVDIGVHPITLLPTQSVTLFANQLRHDTLRVYALGGEREATKHMSQVTTQTPNVGTGSALDAQCDFREDGGSRVHHFNRVNSHGSRLGHSGDAFPSHIAQPTSVELDGGVGGHHLVDRANEARNEEGKEGERGYELFDVFLCEGGELGVSCLWMTNFTVLQLCVIIPLPHITRLITIPIQHVNGTTLPIQHTNGTTNQTTPTHPTCYSQDWETSAQSGRSSDTSSSQGGTTPHAPLSQGIQGRASYWNSRR